MVLCCGSSAVVGLLASCFAAFLQEGNIHKKQGKSENHSHPTPFIELGESCYRERRAAQSA